MEVQEVLDRISQVYGNCNAYEDEGCVTSRNLITNTVSVGRFRTTFKRGSLFAFDWLDVDSGKEVKLNCNSNGAFLTSSTGWREEYKSTESGIGAMFGASRGVTYVVPTMLFSGLVPGKPRISMLADARLVEPVSENVQKVVGRLNEDFCELNINLETSALIECTLSTRLSAEQFQLGLTRIHELQTKEQLSECRPKQCELLDHIWYERVDIGP